MNKGILLAMLLLLVFGSTSEAQRRKTKDKKAEFSFPELFSDKKDLKAMEGPERWPSIMCGLFSNYDYLKEKGLLGRTDVSIFQQQMDQAIIPIWKEKWTEKRWWGYMIRYFMNKPMQPITQLIFLMELNEDGKSFTMTTYGIKPDRMHRLIGKWWEENPLPELTEEDFSEEVCIIGGKFQEDGSFLTETEKPCDAGTSLNFKSYDLSSMINMDVWTLAMAFYDAKGQTLFKDQESIVFRRLTQKEIEKRVSEYKANFNRR